MELWSFWLILGVGFLIVEVLSLSAVCIYVALGAFIAMGFALAGCGWSVTIPVFVVATIILYLSTFAWRKRIIRSLHKSSESATTGMDALIGRTGLLTEMGGSLRLKIDGDIWQVRASDPEQALAVGQMVKVAGYDSIILLVTPIKRNQ